MQTTTEDIRLVLDEAMQKVNEDGADSILVLVKSGGQYVRYSSPLDSVPETIAQLEMLKYDILRRAYE
jgi:hypothetical protein